MQGVDVTDQVWFPAPKGGFEREDSLERPELPLRVTQMFLWETELRGGLLSGENQRGFDAESNLTGESSRLIRATECPDRSIQVSTQTK